MPDAERTVIEHLDLLSQDPAIGELVDTTLIIAGGRIEAIIPNASPDVRGTSDQAPAPDPDPARSSAAAPGDTVIDGSRLLALPGFIDTHRHTWQSAIKHSYAELDPRVYFAEVLRSIGASYQPDDVYIGTLLGSAAALSSGTTTLFDWSHVQNSPAHSDAAIAGLRESGIRATFGHGWPTSYDDSWTANSTRAHSPDIRRIQKEYFSNGPLDDRLTLAMALRGPEEASPETWKHELALARELGLRVSVHTGAYAVHADSHAVRQYAEAGLLGTDMTFVHCNHLADDELDAIASAGAAVSLGIHCELNSTGIGRIPLFRLLERGILPSLSGDTETKCSGDMFTQMRMLWAFYRSSLTALGPEVGRTMPVLTLRDILGFATIRGAHALGMQHEVGSLTPGKRADIVFLQKDALNLAPMQDPVASIVLAAHEGNVSDVMVGGAFTKRNGLLCDIDTVQLVDTAREAQQHLLRRAKAAR